MSNSPANRKPPQTPLIILFPGHMQIFPKVDCVYGKCRPYAKVTIRINNHPIQSTKADKHGHWSIHPEYPLFPGSYTLCALSSQATDNTANSCFMIARCKDGTTNDDHAKDPPHAILNTDEPAQAVNQSIDEIDLPPLPVLPEPPLISYPAEGQEITENYPKITGTAKQGHLVIICIRGMMCTRTLTDDEGNYSASFTQKLTPGNYTVTAQQMDSDGNRSETTEHSFIVT